MSIPRPVVAITGGGSGIGRATAVLLARDGYDVVVMGRRLPELSETVEVAARSGGSHRAVSMDVADPASIAAGFAGLRSLAGLVTAAGLAIRGPAVDSSAEDWLSLWRVNLLGAVDCCRAALPALERGGGSIVNVGSTGALFGFSERVAYSSSKAALEGATRGLAVEWAPRGIRVNSVLPGWTRTEMVAEAVAQGRLDERAVSHRVPLRRLAEPAEIAGAIAFLLSPRASYLTGQGLIVDGGFMINADASPAGGES